MLASSSALYTTPQTVPSEAKWLRARCSCRRSSALPLSSLDRGPILAPFPISPHLGGRLRQSYLSPAMSLKTVGLALLALLFKFRFGYPGRIR